MNSTVLTEGSWQRAFANSNDRSRFTAPTVEGINYPKCGVSKAFNDDDSNLHVSIYAATPSAKGEETSFHITNIDDAQRKNIEITCNGSKFENLNEMLVSLRSIPLSMRCLLLSKIQDIQNRGKRFYLLR